MTRTPIFLIWGLLVNISTPDTTAPPTPVVHAGHYPVGYPPRMIILTNRLRMKKHRPPSYIRWGWAKSRVGLKRESNRSQAARDGYDERERAKREAGNMHPDENGGNLNCPIQLDRRPFPYPKKRVPFPSATSSRIL